MPGLSVFSQCTLNSTRVLVIDADSLLSPETYFDVRDESTPDGGLPELQERQLADVPSALGHLDRGEVDIADLER